jgi:hypothetical protein
MPAEQESDATLPTTLASALYNIPILACVIPKNDAVLLDVEHAELTREALDC